MHTKDNKPIMARQPDFIYNDSKEFINALNDCISWLEKDIIIYQKIPREITIAQAVLESNYGCLLYTSPSPRDRTRSRMPSSA